MIAYMPAIRVLLIGLTTLTNLSGLFDCYAIEQAPVPSAALASKYNNAHQGRTGDCYLLKNPKALIPLRYADGTPRGYYVSGEYPVTKRQSTSRDAENPDRSACPPGTTEIDAREIVDSPAGKMVFHPGGGSYAHYPGGVNQWGQYGHILLSDFSKSQLLPVIHEGQPAGNGLECATAKPGQTNYGEYYIKPMSIDDEMWYKKPHAKMTGSRYLNYGDRGHGGMYLVWNWVQNGNPSLEEKDNHVPGGGYVRAVLKRSMIFYRCDVEPLKTVSYGLDDQQNGWVTVVYGKTYTGKQWIYGWTIHSYEKWNHNPKGQIQKKYVEVLWPISKGPLPN